MSVLTTIQLVVALAIIGLILLQERGAGAGGLIGGSSGGEVYHRRRGLERIIFAATVVLVLAFVALSIAHLVA